MSVCLVDVQSMLMTIRFFADKRSQQAQTGKKERIMNEWTWLCTYEQVQMNYDRNALSIVSKVET